MLYFPPYFLPYYLHSNYLHSNYLHAILVRVLHWAISSFTCYSWPKFQHRQPLHPFNNLIVIRPHALIMGRGG